MSGATDALIIDRIDHGLMDPSYQGTRRRAALPAQRTVFRSIRKRSERGGTARGRIHLTLRTRNVRRGSSSQSSGKSGDQSSDASGDPPSGTPDGAPRCGSSSWHGLQGELFGVGDREAYCIR